ncbi:MAG: FHA domain-containing protein [Chitinispirillales bacterium]|jgi:ABC-type multidrug transport system ATPase subunit/pSer/pThr/pTyr-binding forkhead associated (FHA) protein|nr:FHA domain-containing protein [Chitinispirillales bacterium]
MISVDSVKTAARTKFSFPLDGSERRIGRDPACDICLAGVGVSRHHAVIRCDGVSPSVTDSDSTFGIRINDTPVKTGGLLNGSILTIGIQVLRIDIRDGYINLTVLEKESGDVSSQYENKGIWRIGRDTANDICLPHPLVSRFHAIVRTNQNGLIIVDQGSSNSTYVNGRAVRTAALGEGDAVHIGPFRFYVSGGKFLRADDLNKIKIEGCALGLRIKGKKLLDDVSLVIEPGAFVALLGASGAGKSTLSRVLSGQVAPTSGRLFMNGFPVDKFGAAFTRGIGYVSQQVLLRPELTVWETLTDQSLIRLPGDSTANERLMRAEEVLELMELKRLRNHRVANLSGGEARRLHVGVELLASPAALILDEPLAGLDPGLIGKFMQLFRRICDKGHTLILVTHTLEQLELCDRAVFMQMGKVRFCGPPQQLCVHFGVSNLSEVYEKAASSETASQNRQVHTEQIAPQHSGQNISHVEWSAKFRHPLKKISFFTRQISAMTSRYTNIYIRDHRNISLLLLQTPLITVLLGLVYEKASIALFETGLYFCLTVTGIWVGGLDAVREVARERHLLNREAKCGMNRFSYIIARVITAAVLSAVQSLFFTIFTVIIFNHITFSMELLILLFTAIFSGNLLGLAVSAWSSNVGRAISTLPIILIPQIFFSGILVPFEHMSKWGEKLSHLTISRPIFGRMKGVFLREETLFWHREWTELFLLCAGLIILFWAALKGARADRHGAGA